MLMMKTHRPRNVNCARAAALLYGDWGTSKAYVIGLAFALLGYASFWPILAVSVLSLLVGLTYIIICKYYPEGGGVYASVRRRARANMRYEWLAFVGAFFLVADYLVTASLSALAAFSYLHTPDPVLFAAVFILLIGLVNYLGPRHTGTFALIISIAAVSVFTVLAVTSLPFLAQGWHNLEPLKGSPLTFWTQFCSVIVALSGVETIANTTSIMKLNPESTPQKLLVTRTSTPALLIVMLEVAIYTALFGLAAASINSFTFSNQTVSAPGFTNLENNMLSYLALTFGTKLFGGAIGHFFSQLMSIIVGLILLSAVNTAMNGLISLQYLMASDEELPASFRKVNKYGVPLLPLLVVALLPALLVITFKKLVLLADLYAIGFVGAIAANLFATSTDSRLGLPKRERYFMFTVFLIMGAIWITLFIQKSHARYFLLGIMFLGLGLRWFTKVMQKKRAVAPIAPQQEIEERKGINLCVVRRFDAAIKIAIDESNRHQIPLNVVILREQRVISETDRKRSPLKDPIAKKIINYINTHGNPQLITYSYYVTDSFPDMAVAYAMKLEASKLFIDTPRSQTLVLIRGNYVEAIRKHLPTETELVVVSP